MKKVERINVIMRYINNRSHFTISEIMREFNISRATAIRRGFSLSTISPMSKSTQRKKD